MATRTVHLTRDHTGAFIGQERTLGRLNPSGTVRYAHHHERHFAVGAGAAGAAALVAGGVYAHHRYRKAHPKGGR